MSFRTRMVLAALAVGVFAILAASIGGVLWLRATPSSIPSTTCSSRRRTEVEQLATSGAVTIDGSSGIVRNITTPIDPAVLDRRTAVDPRPAGHRLGASGGGRNRARLFRRHPTRWRRVA